MRRLLTTSALVALAVCVTNASGQPPASTLPQPMPKAAEKTPSDDLLKEAKARQLIEQQREKVQADAAIAAALASDPDVKMARAKIQLAEAELAKARQAVTLKVVTLRAKIDQFKTEVASAQTQVARLTQLFERGSIPLTELAPQRDKLDAARAGLALAEAELKLLTGGAADKSVPVLGEVILDDTAVRQRREYIDAMMVLSRFATPAGAIPDRIRAALDKPVKLGAKGEAVKIGQALEVFKKEAGLDVPVRGELLHERPQYDEKGKPFSGPGGLPLTVFNQIVSEGETLPVGAWLQLFQDVSGGTFYVREYGLLFADRKSAPSDAPTVTEFWKQKPAAKPEAKAEPKK